MRARTKSKLWAITCLFNPAGYRIRAENYRLFREHLSLPLVTVELAFDEPFCLGQNDADVLIQLRGGKPMWQKERLLNIALQSLPDHCEKVVWMDADILVIDAGWAQAVEQALEETKVVQPFATVHQLDPRGNRTTSNPSMVSSWKETGVFGKALPSVVGRAPGAPCNGHVWAARKDILARHGLYDGCIIGGGDTAFLCGVTGFFAEVIRGHAMGLAQSKRYLSWARRLYADVKGDVGWLPYEVEHLWHGRMEDRKGSERHQGLAAVGFDPYRDLALAQSGAWTWNSDRPELHSYVLDYFLSRREDVETEVGRA